MEKILYKYQDLFGASHVVFIFFIFASTTLRQEKHQPANGGDSQAVKLGIVHHIVSSSAGWPSLCFQGLFSAIFFGWGFRTILFWGWAQKIVNLVQWYKTMTSDKALVNCSDDEDENECQHEDIEAMREAKCATRKRKARERRARKNKTWKKKGINLLKLAMQKFPSCVGPNTSLCRWVKAAERQRWADLPEQVRRDHKEIPDTWKRAAQSDSRVKGQRRILKVPNLVYICWKDIFITKTCVFFSGATVDGSEIPNNQLGWC